MDIYKRLAIQEQLEKLISEKFKESGITNPAVDDVIDMCVYFWGLDELENFDVNSDLVIETQDRHVVISTYNTNRHLRNDGTDFTIKKRIDVMQYEDYDMGIQSDYRALLFEACDINAFSEDGVYELDKAHLYPSFKDSRFFNKDGIEMVRKMTKYDDYFEFMGKVPHYEIKVVREGIKKLSYQREEHHSRIYKNYRNCDNPRIGLSFDRWVTYGVAENKQPRHRYQLIAIPEKRFPRYDWEISKKVQPVTAKQFDYVSRICGDINNVQLEGLSNFSNEEFTDEIIESYREPSVFRDEQYLYECYLEESNNKHRR